MYSIYLLAAADIIFRQFVSFHISLITFINVIRSSYKVLHLSIYVQYAIVDKY